MWCGAVKVGSLAAFAALAAAVAHASPSPEKPAATMNDLRDHFSGCFQPPQEAAGSRVTFYFSLNTRGQALAPPRTTWIGFKGSDDEKASRIADFKNAFAKCLPLSMSDEFAETIPGKVYYLQYIVADTGHTSQVLLRPFGSHYYDPYLPLEPTPLFRQPRLAPVRVPGPGRIVRPPVRIFRPFFPRFPIFVRRHADGARVLVRPGVPPLRLR